MFIGFFVFGPSGHDDSHITFAAVQQLVNEGAITNLNSDWVEQGSSILHVSLLAALHAITGYSLPALGTLFSLFMALLCLPLVYRVACLMGVGNPRLAQYLTIISTAFSYWAMGGLETSLIAFLLLLSSLRLYYFLQNGSLSNLVFLSLSLLFYLTSRPESVFIIALMLVAFLGYQLLINRETNYIKPILVVLSIVILFFILIAAVRYQFYQQIFPQPVYAKIGASSNYLEKIGFGFVYYVFSLQLSIVIYSLLFLALLFKIIKSASNNVLLIIILAAVGALLAFVFASGGDWMASGRFFAPIIPFFVCLALYFLQGFKRYKLFVGVIIAICIAEILFHTANFYTTNMPLTLQKSFADSLVHPVEWGGYDWSEKTNYTHITDIVLLQYLSPVVKALSERKEPVNIGSIQMGMVPYHLKKQFGSQIYFIDLRGLTTKHLTECSGFDHYPRNWQGVFIQYKDYFHVSTSSECELPQIDIIFETLPIPGEYSQQRLQSIEENGYKIIYRQEGWIKAAPLPKHARADYFIAVSDEMYSYLPEELRNRSYHFEYNK